jgi:CubicO group peptidase (beta-lactamase class C family)
MRKRLPALLGAALMLTVAAPLAHAAKPVVRAAAVAPIPAAALQAALDYAQSQNTTGFLMMQNGKVIVERNWPLSADAAQFKANFTYGIAADGALLEDVASQQKSFIAILAAVAVDKGLLDVSKPVSAYVGAGWSKAPAEAEGRITVLHLLTMTSGLGEDFTYAAPAGETFLYNTPVYATLKPVLAAAAGKPIEALTRDWLTAPLGMADTAWRPRPAAFANTGNPTGLVTTPRDVAKMGQLVLDGGRTPDGRQLVSPAQMRAMFQPTAVNPAYGRLWWLNGSTFSIQPLAKRVDGPMIPAAPADLVAALGAMDRKLYVVPSRKLIVVRMGQAATDKDFDQQLWLRLAPALK